jgi:glycosyltransferase involved in cell wall biosynthesis
VLQLAAGLRGNGDEVEVLGRGPGGAAGPKVFFPLFAVVPAVWRALRRFRPHVVQVHESDGALAAFLVAVLAPLLVPRPLLVALLQVSYVEELRAVRPLIFRGRVLGRPGGVELRFRRSRRPSRSSWGGSRPSCRRPGADAQRRHAAEEVRRDYGATEVAVLPNVTGGLDVEAAPRAEEAAAPGYLLFVGRLRIRKGVEVLLEALALLGQQRRERPEAVLLIAGDGEHRPALERRAGELGLGGAARFLGRCGAPRVRGLLAGATALVVPSTYEGMPLVVLEAMEAGLPVVASAVSGIPEVVVDGETGWLVPPEDPERLAAALAEALDRPEEARRRGEAGRRRVEALYRPERAAEVWREVVLAGSPRPVTR